YLAASAPWLQKRREPCRFQSNFWRAVRLSGIAIPPGRHAAPLSEMWAALQRRIGDDGMRRKLSRFMHVASEQGWTPSEITEQQIQKFRSLLSQKCFKSKVDRVLRNTARQWNRAATTITGWPERQLTDNSKDWKYIRPWTDFPPSYRDDVEEFVGGAEIN